MRKRVSGAASPKLIVLIVVLVACLSVAGFLLAGSGGQVSGRYFVDLADGNLFVGPVAMAPIPSPSGTGEAVTAHVYACGDCDAETFIAFIEKYTDAGKDVQAKLIAIGPDNPPERADLEATLAENHFLASYSEGTAADAIEWVSFESADAGAVRRDALARCTSARAVRCMETAPVPTDNRVYVREVPGRLMAVRQFSGRWRDANFGREERQLTAAIEGDGVGLIGSMERAAYNGPSHCHSCAVMKSWWLSTGCPTVSSMTSVLPHSPDSPATLRGPASAIVAA